MVSEKAEYLFSLVLRHKDIVVIFAIVACAAVLYFWNLGMADVVSDEAWFFVRSLGMVDFNMLPTPDTTPWQWVENVPWWMHLSFYDHPALVFIFQHASFLLFGETPVAGRIPSVVAGLASILFLYFIGKRLYSPAVGFASALLLAFTVNHVWISRIGLLESIMIALMLASFAAFLKGLESERWLYGSALLLGSAVLAKYPALALLPIFFVILFIRRPRFFYSREIALFFAIVAFIASPVIIYNIQLYRNFGHFDYYLSSLFGQTVSAWPTRNSRELAGPLEDRIRFFAPSLVRDHSPYFLTLVGAGAAFVFFDIARRKALRRHVELLITTGVLIPAVIFLGPASRFLAILTPWFALCAGVAVLRGTRRAATRFFQGKHTRVFFVSFLAVVGVVEVVYSANTFFTSVPFGRHLWTYNGGFFQQSRNRGFGELDRYLSDELKNQFPGTPALLPYSFIQDRVRAAYQSAHEKNFKPANVGFIVNSNLNLPAQEWIFARRVIYYGWPVIWTGQLKSDGLKILQEHNAKKIYFINPTSFALQDRPRKPSPDGDLFESHLRSLGFQPTREITDGRGRVVFHVYVLDM